MATYHPPRTPHHLYHSHALLICFAVACMPTIFVRGRPLPFTTFLIMTTQIYHMLIIAHLFLGFVYHIYTTYISKHTGDVWLSGIGVTTQP